MKIVGVAACAAGIAHTYIAKEKLVSAAESLGHEVHIETQGIIGVKDKLQEKDIKEADVVIIAADIKINDMERFKGKKTVEVSTDTVIKSPKKLIKKIESVVTK
ncbi:PTS fructose transporter subunit IIB [Maledivibacter halophilus]|uniref:PTS system IIB component, Fru family (TC 4.A.2) n=1 Tax=Maledivibacter halophilus TaxID=36842 RepID=A0A1T5K5T1_9FIRM|nr:PTS fructose transporter subunit IIB [Maledivibacter halophilus]SKC59076.1 PTS system IIB component, Fru family (TC 4.A.2) [Maledivibacter halophilus]